MIDRRQFLIKAAATSAIGRTQAIPAVAALRASDGTLVESSGEFDTWSAPPGSTAKPFVIAKLLHTGKLKARETFLCRGNYQIAGRNFTCSHPSGLAPLDPARILAYSCNGAVAHFAERLSPGELASALRDAGFRVSFGDFRLQALGEEGVWTTPLILARAYRKLALQQNPVILEGLEGAARYGTANTASLDGISVAGKTGSSTATNGLHAAWFAGFAPSRKPEYVIAVGMQGHSGGSDAAPVASQILRRRFAIAGEQYRVRVRDTVMSVAPEEYVTGVLAGESGVFQQAEALKAMAIVARTYAAHERGRHRAEGFDFCDTTHCQRFEPTSGANTRLRAAVEATAGEMIRFDRRIAFTPYTMSCGGMSEGVQAVWRDVQAPYLGVRADHFCTIKRWGCHLAAANIEKTLRGAGLECPMTLRSVTVARRTASGRAARVKLIGERVVEIDAGAFRFAIGRGLGWNLMRSNWFQVSGAVEMSGQGEGHGVGLCQRGAEAMAAKGHSHREILGFYFPGTTTLNWLKQGGESVTVYGTDSGRDATVLAQAEHLTRILPWPLRSSPVIYLYPDVDAFRSETGEPGWVAAHTEGTRISLQPVAVLQQRGILGKTLHHELLHVAIEQRAAPGLPLWFREGLTEYLSGSLRPQASQGRETDLQERNDQAKALNAYGAALGEVTTLVARYGVSAVTGWVSVGLPEAVTKSKSRVQDTNSK